MDESERTLVQAARSDPAAFGELYRRYLPRIYSYVYYRTRSAAEAEDLTAKVFLQALTHVADYSDRGLPFAAWLFRIAHNLVANWHRDRGRHPVVPLAQLELPKDDALDPAEAEDRELVRRAVAHLSTERQHLIVLKFVEEMSNAEIGRLLGRSEGAVKALLHRTLHSLREHLVELEAGKKEDDDETTASQGG